jgi:hypothetical protein
VTWQRKESTSRCDSCRAYWSVLQDLGEEWDAADPDGWGVLFARGLAAYSQHLTDHLPRTKEKPS